MQKKTLILVIILALALMIVPAGCSRGNISAGDINTTPEDINTAPATDNEPNDAGPVAAELPPQAPENPGQQMIAIPLRGEKDVVSDDHGTPHTPVTIVDSEIFASHSLSDGTELCWYLGNGVKSCAYHRPGGDWTQFLAEDSAYQLSSVVTPNYYALFS